MRRIFTVLAVTAVLSAVAACGDAASPGATASDADLETSRQTVKKLYTDVATEAQSAAGKQADPTLKAALDTLATEATSAATGLDSQPKALTALALLDRSKVEVAATRVTQLCS